MVFSYAGTATLEKEIRLVTIEETKIGVVFITDGFPGHVVIVVDIAVDESTQEKVFLLAQSYMPAQEIQILKKPNNSHLIHWYSSSAIKEELRTPEWTFTNKQLKRFLN